MSIFDLIVEIPNKVKSNVVGLSNKVRGIKAPQLNMELLDEKGGTDITKTMEMLDKTTPLTLGERLTGRTLERDFQKYNPETKQFEMATATINRPGLLQDISKGYEENRFTPASIANLQQNTLDNGREKGFAYRLGEGLGSLARLGNSPLGRGLITGGIVGATGGSGLEALTYGAGATMLNQGNVLRDRTYRNDLINTQKQSLMSSPEWNNLTPAQQQARLSEIENSINNYRGYMTDDIYKNLVNTQQARDNAAYRQMYFDAQLENQKRNEELARERFEYQKTQDKIQNNLAWEKLKNDKNNPKAGRIMPASSATGLSGTLQGVNQMTNLMGQIPKFAKLGLAGPIGSLRRFNPYDANAQAFQQYVNTYKQVIGKGLEGGVLRKEDEAKYEKIIPRMGDTEEVLMRKAQQLQQMLIEKYNTDLESLYNAGYDTGNFGLIVSEQPIINTAQPKTNTSKSNTTKSGVKYEVIN